MSRYATPASLNADAYKSGHVAQYPQGTEFLFFNMTPRSDKYLNTPMNKDGVIAFGLKRFCEDYLRDHWNESFFNQPKKEIVDVTMAIMNGVLGKGAVSRKHWEDLHDLGYLPIVVYGVKEGTLLPIKVPMLAFMPTHKDFAWVAGYLEDAFSNELWKATTIATISMHNRRLAEAWAKVTCDNNVHVPWQFHDFALRGLSGMNDGAFNSVGHLTSFKGTDNFAAVYTALRSYGEGMLISDIGNSVPATEHSVMTANIAINIHDQFGEDADTSSKEQRYQGEKETFRHLMVDTYPTGILSGVADSYNYWRTIGQMAYELKDVIMARDGKVVFRPDSGNPFHVVCGYKAIEFENAKALIINRLKADEYGTLAVETVSGLKQMKDLPYMSWLREDGYELIVDKEDFDGAETFNLKTYEQRWMSTEEINGSLRTLWGTFGGTQNSKGFNLLDEHVGLIYGDSITPKLADEILCRMAEMNFASSNIVFGVGSYTYQYITRDTLGFAVKATYLNARGAEVMLSKDPVTDSVLKKSARGCVLPMKVDGKIVAVDELTPKEFAEKLADSEFELFFADGISTNKDTLEDIRKRIDSVV